MPADWHERLSKIAWFITHLDDVRSDYSVYHRVDDLESMAADRFLVYLPRIAVYGGAVALAIHEAAETSPQEPAVEQSVLTGDQLSALNSQQLYGPLGDHQVGMFEVVSV